MKHLLKMAMICIATVFMMSACSSDDDPVVTAISLSQTSLTLTKGESATLTVSYTPADLQAPTYTWTSSNSAVATVSNGKITAIEEGSTTITVTAKDLNLTASCTVMVNPIVPASININEQSLLLIAGNTSQLTAIVSPSDAKDKSVSWSSSDTNVATVSQDGLITAMAPGTATITAKTNTGGLTATCSVEVKKIEVESVHISNAQLEVIVGQQETLTATILPADATYQGITWTSSDETIATVADGVVTALKVGEITIMASSTDDSSKSASCSITVKSDKDINYDPYGEEQQW